MDKGSALLTLDVLRRRCDRAHRYAAERGLSITRVLVSERFGFLCED
jgi:hypothetical protein